MSLRPPGGDQQYTVGPPAPQDEQERQVSCTWRRMVYVIVGAPAVARPRVSRYRPPKRGMTPHLGAFSPYHRMGGGKA